MILLKDVRKYYGTAAIGLSKINLENKPGEIVGILGENGSGKTTLLKAIMGLTQAYRGEVRIEADLLLKCIRIWPL